MTDPIESSAVCHRPSAIGHQPSAISHPPSTMPDTIWTIGHSTRDLDEFLGLLSGASIGLVADVRRFPGSRGCPHFDGEALSKSLEWAGIAYRHYGDLGARRSGRLAGSPNTAWRVEAFNAFADHMATPSFLAALDDLSARARETPTAIMCKQAVPWRCHRRLIADALTVRGWSVLDIIRPGKVELHALTGFARVEGLRVTYPADPFDS
jgi:uncharacterized protein (DUF488 family)